MDEQLGYNTSFIQNNYRERNNDIIRYYNIQGKILSSPQKGIVIIQYKDNTFRKVFYE